MLPPDRNGLFPDHQHIDWRMDEVGRADHRKLYVVDGAIAWIGGAGIEDHFQNGEFHDVMVRVTGDVVRQAQAAFLTSFRGHAGPLPTDLSPLFPEPAESGSTPIALAQVIPGGFVAASQAIGHQIDEARERLDVMNPYFTDRDMIERILAAARRGVNVRIVVSQKSNNNQATAALKHRYADFVAAGAELWELPGTVVHAKVVVADNVASFGTVHLDAWALYRNSEIMMMARDRRGRGAVQGTAVRARHRSLQTRRAAYGCSSTPRELGVRQARTPIVTRTPATGLPESRCAIRRRGRSCSCP
jgi:cardiolipin synthase